MRWSATVVTSSIPLLRIIDQTFTGSLSKNVSSRVVRVLVLVVAVLAYVAAEMWQFFSGTELKTDRFRLPLAIENSLQVICAHAK